VSTRCTVGLAALLTVAIAGCGASGPGLGPARAAARRFESAVASGDGGGACDTLAPETRQDLETSGNQPTPCPEALVGQHLPVGTSVRSAVVYGDQALVTFGKDTVFLSRFASGWKVTAAGCTPRPRRPYDCALKGG
jgi:hypothetical protein